MTDKQKDDLLKDADAAIGVIKAQHEKELIKYYDIVPMKDKDTGKEIGYGVQMDLTPQLCLRRIDADRLETAAEG